MKDMKFEHYSPKRMSFILPTRNRAALLDKLLSSVHLFKGKDDELIVVDGASTDSTREVLKKYASLIDICISEPDVNCTHAANKGMLLARGKFIKAIHDDDITYPDAMRQAIQTLENNPEIDLLLCGGTKEKNGRITRVYIPPGADYGKNIEDVFRYPRCGAGQFFKREAIARVGLYPPMVIRMDGRVLIHADAEYLLRFIAMGAVVRFCRLNVFHHSYSHYGEFQTTDQYWLDAARQYCSKSFYWKYWMRMRLKPLRRRIRAFRKIMRRNVPMSKLMLDRTASSPPVPVWDGGFS